jgi:hypothetical protein
MLHRRILAVVVLVVVISSPFLPTLDVVWRTGGRPTIRVEMPQADAYISFIRFPPWAYDYLAPIFIGMATLPGPISLGVFGTWLGRHGIRVIIEGLKADDIFVRVTHVREGLFLLTFVAGVKIIMAITAVGTVVFYGVNNPDYKYGYPVADHIDIVRDQNCDDSCYLDIAAEGIPITPWQSEVGEMCWAHYRPDPSSGDSNGFGVPCYDCVEWCECDWSYNRFGLNWTAAGAPWCFRPGWIPYLGGVNYWP